VYAGVDPLTGRELRLVESAADEATAKQILNRLLAKVEGQEHARTRATLGTALDSWLRVHEVEENTRQEYEAYTRKHIKPALGDVPSARSRPRCWRTSTPSCDGVGPAATAAPPSTTEPTSPTSAGWSGGTVGRPVALRRPATPSTTAIRRAARRSSARRMSVDRCHA